MTVSSSVSAALFALTLAFAAGEARAVTCFLVFDRTDNVVYRDVYPPVDLSEAGASERDALRRRGEYMLFMEVETCPRLEFFTGVAGNVGLRLDEALAPSAQGQAGEAKPEAKPAAPRRTKKPAAKG